MIATTVTRVTLLVLEEIPKRSLIINPTIRDLSSGEATSGFWCRAFFFFLGPIFSLGYHNILSMENLQSIGLEFSSQRLFTGIKRRWKPAKRTKAHSLFWACCWEFKGAMLAVLIPRLCQIGLTFSQPFTMQTVIVLMDSEGDKHDEKSGAIGAVLISFAGAAVSRAIAAHMTQRLVTRVRGAVLSMLLDKSLKLKLTEAQRNAAITLMSADFDAVSEGLPSLLEIPFTMIETAVGMYLLTKFVKQSSFVIVFPLLFAICVGFIIGRRMTKNLVKWNGLIQHRVTDTSKILAQLPAMKMQGLGPKTIEYLHHLRMKEMEASVSYRTLQAGNIACAILADLLSPTLVIASGLFWGIFGDSLSPEIIYPTLAVVSLVQTPLAALFREWPGALSMFGCLERMREYLCIEEHVDQRVLLGPLAREVTREWPLPDGTTMEMTRLVVEDPQSIIRFDRVTLGSTESDDIIISDIELSIDTGAITALFGPTGSGKSAFINSLLGESDIKAGILFINDIAIAYCGQLTWLPNISLRDCIIGDCEYDEVWFRTVIIACKLLDDIAQLEQGIEYKVGSEGVALSGGQRQRVGIARAAYARKRLVLFDDVFSAQDRDTASAILVNLCGANGLFRQSGTTVVFSTYLPEAMNVADNLICLDEGGNLTFERGPPSEAFRLQILDLLRQETDRITAGDVDEDDEKLLLEEADRQLPPIPQAEDTSRQTGDWSLYVFWIDEMGRLGFIIWLVFIVMTGIIDGFPRIYLKIWIDKSPAEKLFFIGYAVLPFICAVVCGAGVIWLSCHLGPRAAIKLHKRLAIATVQATLGFLSTHDSGSLVNMYSLDMDILTKSVTPALHNTCYYVVSCLLKIGIILSGATYMVALLPVLFFALFYVQRYYLRTSRQLRHLNLEAQAPLVTSVRESSRGLIYIRAFAWQQQTLERGLRLLDQSQKPQYLLNTAQHVLGLATDLLASSMAIVLSIITLYANHGSSRNSVGVSFLSIVILGSCLDIMVISWTKLEIAIGALSRLRAFLMRTPQERGRSTDALPAHWPSRGEVEMRHVSARHRTDATVRAPVIRNVSVTFEAGKKFGIKGRSGSGKSSLLHTLLGFLDYDGTVLIDGVDISTVPLDELRSRIITISQDQVELPGTIRDNLLPFDKIWGTPAAELEGSEKEEAERRDRIAIETLVRLRIWDQVAERGLDTPMADAGYSYGEKQLLGIARAVVRRRLTGSRLLLVDEATGSVDGWRDQIVREMIMEYFKGCTILIVAHREESIADTNMTVEMSFGEMGEPVWYF